MDATVPPLSLVVQEGVALLGQLAVVAHGLQRGQDLLETGPLLHRPPPPHAAVSTLAR